MKHPNRKTEILAKLKNARVELALARAQRGFPSGPLWLKRAQRHIEEARALMAEAPASSRRRWMHSDTINARKRQARAESYPNTMFRGRCVYQSL